MREEWDVAGLTDLRNVMVRMIELATKTVEEGKLLESGEGSRWKEVLEKAKTSVDATVSQAAESALKRWSEFSVC